MEKGIDPGLGKQVIASLMAEPDFVGSMRDAILGALGASNERWDKATKGFIDVPDYRARLDAWKIIMAYAEGLPLMRILKQELATGTQRSLSEDLRESPALLAAVEKELEKAKFRTRHTKIAQVVSVEIEVPE